MTLEVFWFVLSGFVIGFAVSTFWEWLYYRGRRIQWRDQRVTELEAKLSRQSAVQSQQETVSSPGKSDSMPDISPIASHTARSPQALNYRSQAALLRSEQEAEDELS